MFHKQTRFCEKFNESRKCADNQLVEYHTSEQQLVSYEYPLVMCVCEVGAYLRLCMNEDSSLVM